MRRFPINRRRLAWCRKNYRIGLDEMAARAGLRPALLRRAAKGEEALTCQQLWDLGRALDLELSFFMDPGGVSKEEMPLPRFRAAACRPRPGTEAMMLIGRALRHRSYFAGLLEISPGPPARKVRYPRLQPGASWGSRAKAVRRWLGIGGGEGFAELRERVEAKGVKVFVSSSWGRWKIPAAGGREEFKGFVLRHEVLPVIFVANEPDDRSRSFILMHELAHLIMHKGDMIDGQRSLGILHRGNRREREANALAGHVLQPEEARRREDVAVPAAEVWSILGRRYVNEVLAAEASKEITLYKALVYLDVDLKIFQAMMKTKFHRSA